MSGFKCYSLYNSNGKWRSWTETAVPSWVGGFHFTCMPCSLVLCRRKQPLPVLSVYWISPQKLPQTSEAEGQCGLGYSQLLPTSPGPCSTSPSSLPWAAPTASAAAAALPAEKRRNFLTHAEPQEHWLPGLPGSHWHGIDAEDERTGMSLGLEKKWSFCDYFCSDPSFSLSVWLLFKISLHVDFWGYCSFQCHMKSLWGSLTDGF